MFSLFVTYLMLCLSAFAAGAVNSIAGGGTLLTFPTLQMVLTAKAANVTSTVALVPGSMAGAWGFRKNLEGAKPWLLLLIAPSILGGLVGSLLLTEMEDKYFVLVVPWLLLLAATLFGVQPYLNRFLPAAAPARHSSWALRTVLVAFQFFVGVYGGYFGAGIGILMLASLSLMGVGDVHRMNAIKTILASCINGVSVLVFIVENLLAGTHDVEWRLAPVMIVTSILGGYFGAHFSRLLPRRVVRLIVISIGLGLAAYYFAKQAGLFAPPTT